MDDCCSKCGSKLGTYEFNRVGDSVYCDVCVSTENEQKKLPPKIKGELTTINSHVKLTSVDGEVSNVTIWLTVFLCAVTLLFAVTIGFVGLLFCVIPSLIYVLYKYNSMCTYSLKGETLTVNNSIKSDEKKIDLSLVTRYEIFRYQGRSLGKPYCNLKLFDDEKLLANIDSHYIKNYAQMEECVVNNIKRLNNGHKLSHENKWLLNIDVYTIFKSDVDEAIIDVDEEPEYDEEKIIQTLLAREIEDSEVVDCETYKPSVCILKENEVSYWDAYYGND